MPAAFRQVFPYAGVDEKIPTGGAGIVVPLSPKNGGSNLVILEGGPAHRVASTLVPSVQVEELTDPSQLMAVVIQQFPWPLPPELQIVRRGIQLAMLQTKTLRVFKVTANSTVGYDRVKVLATDPRTSKVETLKVLVLKQKVVKIAIRPVHVRDGQGKPVPYTNVPFDPQSLLDLLNSIWTPQANIAFRLGRTDAAVIDGLTLYSGYASPDNPTQASSFRENRDSTADFTAFLVRVAQERANGPRGVAVPRDGFALIGDDRGPTTLAHEAGHLLGSLNENGTYSGTDYGHQGTDPELLMRDGGAGWKIPYSIVTDFNKGFYRN